jgi:hypothetical protein
LKAGIDVVNGTKTRRKGTNVSDPSEDYSIALMVEHAARDVLVPASKDANFRILDHNVYDVASQIAHRFTEIHTEWTKHGRALESDEKPTVP